MNRRTFVNRAALGSATLALTPQLLSAIELKEAGAEPIRVALIGKGGMGTADFRTACRVPGVVPIAVCDVFDKRLDEAKVEFGNSLIVSRDYRDVLNLSQLDAVIIGTPDHWHQQIAIEAMNNGKHVYCEKPVLHKVSEGRSLVNTQRKTGMVFQMGTQGISSVGNEIARILIQHNSIGQINLIKANFTGAPDSLKAFIAPADVNDRTIWWERFLGKARRIPFSAQRFLEWRHWKDYGTGLAGDLYVHVIASVHYITGSLGPERVYTTGGIRYYNNGSRDTPDFMQTVFDYDQKGGTKPFTLLVGANMVDGVSNEWGSTDIKIIGEQGQLGVGWDKITIKSRHEIHENQFSRLLEDVKGIKRVERASPKELVIMVDELYSDAHYRHFQSFFEAIKTGRKPSANVVFGVGASTAALLAFESYSKGKVISSDPRMIT